MPTPPWGLAPPDLFEGQKSSVSPVEPLLGDLHPVHVLTLVGVGEQHEGFVGREVDLIGGMTVCTTAVKDHRITAVRSIRHRAAITVFVPLVFVVPLNESTTEAW